MTREIDIEILGKSFTFQLADGVSAEEFLQISEHVENKIRKIKEITNELDSFRLALLAAINISQELHALKQENVKLRQILANIDHLLAPATDSEDLTIRLSSKRRTE